MDILELREREAPILKIYITANASGSFILLTLWHTERELKGGTRCRGKVAR